MIFLWVCFCVKNARYILRWETLSLAGCMAPYGKKVFSFVNVIVLAISLPHKRKRQFAVLFA